MELPREKREIYEKPEHLRLNPLFKRIQTCFYTTEKCECFVNIIISIEISVEIYYNVIVRK